MSAPDWKFASVKDVYVRLVVAVSGEFCARAERAFVVVEVTMLVFVFQVMSQFLEISELFATADTYLFFAMIGQSVEERV